jgi:hypothetical protein
MQTLAQILFLILIFSQGLAFAQKKAQAANPQVDIYGAPDFDAEVIQTITPGQYYQISNKPKGAFYQIKLKNGKIGYVPDTELDISGEGVFKPKPFANSEDEAESKANRGKNKNFSEDDEDQDNPDSEKLSFHAVTLQLINYHEETLGAVQIGDLFAIGYRHLPLLNEFSSSLAWDVAAAFSAPKYYKDLTGRSASGFALWSGFQVVNISALGSNETLHYGAGPFIKFTQFEVSSSQRGYTLQDLTVGVTLDAGLIFHFIDFSFDAGLKYYVDKKSYGALTVGVLF